MVIKVKEPGLNGTHPEIPREHTLECFVNVNTINQFLE